MEGPKRNDDKLNTIGIVAIGICGAVFVYVSVVLLQAFYMGETASVETAADFGGQGNTYKTLRAAQQTFVTEVGRNAGGPDQPQTYRIPVDHAMQIVVDEAKRDPSNLVPVVGKSNTPTIKAVFGRPQPLATAPAPAPADAAAAPGAAPGAAPAVTAPVDGSPAAPGPGGATPAPATEVSRPAGQTTPPGLAPPAGATDAPAAPSTQAPATAPAPAKPAPAAPGATAPARPAKQRGNAP
jgi:hypothetical protein